MLSNDLQQSRETIPMKIVIYYDPRLPMQTTYQLETWNLTNIFLSVTIFVNLFFLVLFNAESQVSLCHYL